MRVKIAVAEEKAYIVNCLPLIKDVDFELLWTVDNRRDFCKLIEAKVPDIVFVDISSSKIDGVELARIYKNKYVRIDFILVSEVGGYEKVLEALRVGANDFLVKSAVAEEFVDVVKRAAARQLVKITHVHDYDYALRANYIGNLTSIIEMNMTIESVNLHYGTRYSRGAFQGFFIKLDSSENLDWFSADTISSENIKKLYLELISRYCYDILFEKKLDGIFVILNYKPEEEQLILKKIYESHNKLQKMFDKVHDVQFTICVGRAKDNINALRETRREAFEALWSRKVVGKGDVILWEEHRAEVSSEYRRKLTASYEKIRRAYIKLDGSAMKAALHDLFSLPEEVVKSGEVRHAMRNIINEFYETYKSSISMLPGGLSVVEFTSRLKVTASLNEYEETLVELFEELFRKLQKIAGRKETFARLADEYVREHFDERIKLQDVSDYLMLSPAYFSSIYKEVRNKNFFDYITEYRMERAKELLKDVKMNTAQVAEKCGYTDTRYFARVFKSVVGATPTEFRKNC